MDIHRARSDISQCIDVLQNANRKALEDNAAAVNLPQDQKGFAMKEARRIMASQIEDTMIRMRQVAIDLRS